MNISRGQGKQTVHMIQKKTSYIMTWILKMRLYNLLCKDHQPDWGVIPKLQLSQKSSHSLMDTDTWDFLLANTQRYFLILAATYRKPFVSWCCEWWLDWSVANPWNISSNGMAHEISYVLCVWNSLTYTMDSFGRSADSVPYFVFYCISSGLRLC